MADDGGCVFCGLWEKVGLAQKDDDILLIEPLNPVTEGHLLFIPREHIADAGENPATAGRLMQAAAGYGRAFGMDFNIITSVGAVATQTVFHLHVHFVPRRPGDGLHLPWTGQLGSKNSWAAGHAERADKAEAELARLHAGEDPEPPAEGVVGTAGQWLHRFNHVDPEERLLVVGTLRELANLGDTCFTQNHAARLARAGNNEVHLRQQLDRAQQLLARIAQRDDVKMAKVLERQVAAVRALIGDCAGHLHVAAEVERCPWCKVRAALDGAVPDLPPLSEDPVAIRLGLVAPPAPEPGESATS